MEKFKLTDSDREKLTNLEIDLNDIDNQIDRLKEIGADVNELESAIRSAKKLRKGLLDTY